MTSAEKLNIILMMSLTIAFTCGYVVGAIHGPQEPQVPQNWNPALSDANASLRACNEVLAMQTKACANREVSH